MLLVYYGYTVSLLGAHLPLTAIEPVGGIDHRVCDVTTDLRLSSQLQTITALSSVQNHTAWCVCVCVCV